MTSESVVPETLYAECDGLSIAYQVFGGGAQDLVMVQGILSDLEVLWSDPEYARMCRTLPP